MEAVKAKKDRGRRRSGRAGCPVQDQIMRLHLTVKASLLAAFGLLALLCAGQAVLMALTLSGIRADVTGVAMN